MNTQEKQAITLVANINAKPEHAEALKSELLKLAKASQAEQGAIQYNIHQDNDNPNNFITYEVWENQELMEQHGQSEHFQNFMKVTKDMIDDSKMTQMTRIA
ncbi:putative quinol monooxygenase [uncultured Psychrobacter sp.]|uniref:putative quinol monooxygenase n=1 Tax=uncultured Psychrobacter sp. TaxID=259303 RepID=UPI003457563E